jgi:hypothetical protein
MYLRCMLSVADAEINDMAATNAGIGVPATAGARRCAASD